MELTKLKIAEYLRTYWLTFSKSVHKKIPMMDAFSEIIANKESDLTIDEFPIMLLIKNYFSTAKILSVVKDAFLTGIYNKDDTTIINNDSLLNKICTNNFAPKDIILNTRNALFHNNQGPLKYWIVVDQNQKIKLHILLRATKATKGDNAGQIVPFEVEIDNFDLLNMANYCLTQSNILHIGGIKYKKRPKQHLKSLGNLQLLKLLADDTFYTYELYKPLSIKEKKELQTYIAQNKKEEIVQLLRKKLEKNCRKELSIPQKQTIYYNIYRYILSISILDDSETSQSLRNITFEEIEKLPVDMFGTIVNKRYEYEALKVIPIGNEKKNIHLIGILNNLILMSNNGKTSVSENIVRINRSFFDKKTINDIFSMFNRNEEEEQTMFANAIFDVEYQEKENLSIYYGYMLDCLITEPEVKIGNKLYSREHLRDSFVHERWYINISQNDSWELYDCKNGVKNQFNFNWHKSIKNRDLFEAIEAYYNEMKIQESTINRK